jgi:hypothetical protein
MQELETTNTSKGYNLRMDSSTGLVTHELTRKKMSENVKRQFADGTRDREKNSRMISEMWKDEDRKQRMAENVAISSSRYRFYQFDKKTMELLRVWDGMYEILKEHPDFYNITIYSVCNGYKKSYRGYVWRKELKNELEPDGRLSYNDWHKQEISDLQ